MTDLYIYLLDSGKGLFVSRIKMKFNQAFARISEGGFVGGFNYLRRVAVCHGKIIGESHLTPDHQDG